MIDEEVINEYKGIAEKFDAEFLNESKITKSEGLKRLVIRKAINNINIDFVVQDSKYYSLSRPSYSIPFSGVFVQIINKYDFQLEIMNKFGFDFIKEKLNKNYKKCSDRRFGRKFLIRSNDVSIMEKVIKREETKQLMNKLKIAHLGVASRKAFMHEGKLVEKDCFYIEFNEWFHEGESIEKMMEESSYILSNLYNARIIDFE